MIAVEPHPELELAAFTATTDRPQSAIALALPELLRRPMPEPPGAPVVDAVRALLRVGGFKPSGRSKPASEYVRAAIPERRLGPILPLVDACNAASFAFGLPISVVDLDRARPPFRVGLAPAGASYVFNAGGQTIDLGGLLVLTDADGPCANAVKDAQRTKTTPDTCQALAVVWGARSLPGRAAACADWYRAALEDAGFVTHAAALHTASSFGAAPGK